MPSLFYEQQYPGKYVCGLDEVGRGSLAGPLVTAGVILPDSIDLPEINDSKQIPKSEHARLVKEIYEKAIEVRFDVKSASEVDKYTINPAIRKSMTDVVQSFSHKPKVLLIDGSDWQKLDLPIEQKTIVKGDTVSLSIACASLVAKFLHDQIMIKLSKDYPEFGFDTNTGYGTKEHKEALKKYGYTPEHRMSYKPLSAEYYPVYKGGVSE